MQHLASEGSASRLAMVAAEKVLLAPGPAEELGRPPQALGRPRQGGCFLQSALHRSLRPRQGRGRPIHTQASRGCMMRC